MQILKSFVFSILMLVGVTAFAKDSEKIVILNGVFFKELPSAAKNTPMLQDMKLFTINTPNGTRVLCVFSPSIILSEEALKYAIPVENVSDGEELLRRYNEQKEGQGINFTMSATKPLIRVGDPFPQFVATDIDGKIWKNADIDGKVMVLNLWFTGCGPCRREMPELSTWKDEMPDVMFFSSTYETPAVARQVLDKVNFTWIHLVDDKQFKEWIGANGYPLTIVVDKSGNIAAFEYGTSPEQRSALKNKIQTLR